jgi:hypothetical protein
MREMRLAWHLVQESNLAQIGLEGQGSRKLAWKVKEKKTGRTGGRMDDSGEGAGRRIAGRYV